MTNPYGRWIEDPLAPGGHRWARHSERVPAVPEPPPTGDVGDWIDPNAPDPTPDEVVDENDPNFVHPWFGDR